MRWMVKTARRRPLTWLILAVAVAAADSAAARPAAPPTAAQVQAVTVLAGGFTLELVAAEPAVVDPVAITFDDHGRPYVAEYRDYPLGPPPGSPALSRIVRLDEAAGDAFICEPVSHLVTRRRLRPQGAGFTSDHVGGDAAEFLASRDPWFRPVFTATGPDGALWVVDMCRRTVEHPEYMPPGLAETLDLRAGDRAGRIWRVVRTGAAPRPWQPPATAAEAVAALPSGSSCGKALLDFVEKLAATAAGSAASAGADLTGDAAAARGGLSGLLGGSNAAEVQAAAAASPAAASSGASPVGSFRAGAHVEDISPTRFPVPVNGGMQRQLAAGIQDPMQARCLVLDDSTRRLVLVVVDACMIPREITEAAKQLAAKETGIPAEHMLIAATHTHSAAALTPVFQCDVDPDYVATVAPRIARGIAAAVRNLEPAECGWAASSAPDQVFHRRWFVKPGRSYENPFGVTTDTVKMNPGAGSTLVSVPAGPVDQEVAIFAVRGRADGRPLALFANYSLHYVGGVEPISADYFAAFAAEIGPRVAAGDGRYAGKPPFVALLSNGTSGNVNNIDFALSPKHPAAPGSRIRVVASAVAAAAAEAWAAIDWRSDATLDTAQEDLVLGVRKGSPAEIAQANRWLESIPKAAGGQWADLKAIYARETLALAGYPDSVPVMLQVHRIGGLSIAAIPCEVFVETGLRLKRTSPFARHLTVSLANGYNGYLPRAADHSLGGYETWRARSSYLEVEAETKIVAALERLAATVAARQTP